MAQLRELKKQQTRRTISGLARRLFAERGFEGTTIADIAEAAGVSKMTVTNYFPRKEDLCFDAHEEFVRVPSRIVAGRAAGESALAALRRAHLQALDRRDPTPGYSAGLARVIDGSPALRARLRELFEKREQLLAHTLARETHSDPRALTPRVAAAELIAVQRALFDEAHARAAVEEPEERRSSALRTAAEEAFALLEPALGHYAVRRG